MNGLYTETYVKRKMTVGMQALRVLCVAVSILLVVGGLLTATGLLTFLGVGAMIALYFFLPSFNIDWEYVFVDGQIDFDRISGGEKRKTILRVDLDNVDVFAPEHSHELDSYRSQQGITVKKFISNEPDAKRYCLFTSKGNEKLMVIFEPSDKMIEFAKQKSPRKVFLD